MCDLVGITLVGRFNLDGVTLVADLPLAFDFRSCFIKIKFSLP